MHIPDGFLSTPIWLSLDAVSIPAIGYLGRRAQRQTEEARAPLLGVLGAFVFAAQMINFPVGIGTSGHLVGSALLAYTVGPAPAVLVMTAILALQALIFQDGGVLALGANVFNMAFAGVAAAYLPYRLWGTGRWRRLAIFLGGMLSIVVAACLALSELLISGIKMPGGVIVASGGLFLANAAIEGAITVAVIEAMNRLNPAWVRAPAKPGRRLLGGLALAAVLLASIGILFASAAPDGIEKLAEQIGIAGRARSLLDTPLADYQLRLFASPWSREAAAGLIGLAMILLICFGLARLLARRRKT